MSSIKCGNDSACLHALSGGLGEIMCMNTAHRKGSMKFRFYILVIIDISVAILGIVSVELVRKI